MMKIFSVVILSILSLPPCLSSDDFTLYLVRHTEKKAEDKNPSLTHCGKERAKQLSTLLSTANIKSIYSTSYQRTMSTAGPLSNKQRIPIQHYSPKQLEQFSLHLVQRKENALIIGHSNTTPQLTQLLIDKKVDPLAEEDYQMLYQVHFVDSQPFLTKLIQPHRCN